MNGKNDSANGPLAQILGSRSGGPVTVKRIFSKDNIIPAKELPALQADVNGVFISRTGSTITIGTGVTTLGMTSSESGGITPEATFNGPTYEVVITKDTIIYKDTTNFDNGASTSSKIQQTVAPGSLDDLNSISDISVWGKKTGDRYVADTVLYLSPLIKMDGGTGGTNK